MKISKKIKFKMKKEMKESKKWQAFECTPFNWINIERINEFEWKDFKWK